MGKGTAQRVNRTVASVVEAAKTAEKVAETVNYRANSLGNAIQDTVEDTKSSVIGVVDAIKETVEETKSSVVGAAKSVAEGVNYTVNDVKTVGNVVKDAVEEVKPAVRGMQQFLEEGKWEDLVIRQRHWQEVNTTLGEDDGVFIIDGSDFPKQGEYSVGVKRQYCGQLGKRANCQAGVFLGYASRQGYTLLDCRLYLPSEWVNDEAYANKRQRCGVPKDIKFTTKPNLALEMLKTLRQSGQLKGQWVTCDEDYGKDPEFLDAIDALGLWYLADVLPQTQVWCTRPLVQVPAYSGRGQPPKRQRLAPGEASAQTISDIVANLQPQDWSTHVIKEGAFMPDNRRICCFARHQSSSQTAGCRGVVIGASPSSHG